MSDESDVEKRGQRAARARALGLTIAIEQCSRLRHAHASPPDGHPLGGFVAANDSDADADADDDDACAYAYAYAYDSTGDSGAASDDDVPRERSAGESASPPGIGT